MRAGKGLAKLTASSASPVERHEAGQVPRGCASRATHDDGRDVTGAVPAGTSDARTRVPDPLGGGFALHAGRGVKDGVGAAIHLLSVRDGIARAVVHTSTGRFEHEGQRLSLHAGGCISADGTSEAVTGEAAPARAASALPDPPASPEDLAKSVAPVVRLPESGTERSPVAPQVAAALGSLPWRAVRGASPSSIPSSGPTGPRTTSAARLARGCFATGAGPRAGRVRVTWGATLNALRREAFAGRDSLLLVDERTGDTAVQRAGACFPGQGIPDHARSIAAVLRDVARIRDEATRAD